MKIFVPLCEEFDTGIVRGAVMDELGLAPGDLVPFQLHYECLRVGEHFAGADTEVPRA